MQFFTKPKRYDEVTTLEDNDLICYCIEVSKGEIVNVIKQGAKTLKEIKRLTKAYTGSECKEKNPNKRCCSKEINALIKLYWN